MPLPWRETAARLLRTHGILGALLKSGDDTKELQSHAEMLRQNREMVRLEEDTVLPAMIEELELKERTPEFFEAMIACDIDVEKL